MLDAKDATRPIVGIENRTGQEVFDIMCDRFRRALQAVGPEPAVAVKPLEPIFEKYLEPAGRVSGAYPAYLVTQHIKEMIAEIRSALVAIPPAERVVEALPPTREYVDRIVRIFRDRPADDTSAVVLQDYARAALAGSGSGWRNPLEHAVEFVAKMAWRTDPPNANNKLSDTERLSAIKYHPTVKHYGQPHIELAEREAAAPQQGGE